jgi:hypothetical protein
VTVAKAKRLRPGELDGLVLVYLAEHKGDGPLSATAIGKSIERSAGWSDVTNRALGPESLSACTARELTQTAL